MGSFFREPLGSLSDGFFGKSFFAPTMLAPSVNVSVGQSEKPTECACEGKHNIPEDAGEEFRAKRELHALKHQLRSAIHAEEFEKAAELRDKIRGLER